ncbi:hypothetical protein [Pseudomonas lopnurensis]|uniref:hypothetical protein n=1 Tax=Pseudomonas lopnurensis TaxID=1477517 RepID=UPI0028B1B480|nr:hypothetical protein [Pseudomonas lopnurensis]
MPERLSVILQLAVVAVIVAIAFAVHASRPQPETYGQFAKRCLQPKPEAFKSDLTCMYHRNNTFRPDRKGLPQA